MTSTRTLAILAAYGLGFKIPTAAALLLIVAVAGCAQPAMPPPIQTQPWQWQDIRGRAISTRHYRILTTVRDDAAIERVARLMDAAFIQYETLCGPANDRRGPLEIALFSDPAEWERYTIATTGVDAQIYLRVNGGAYTAGDRFVCWLGSETDLYSIAAHEGLHQFIARNFKQRPPPALEEGLATLFESVTMGERTVQFDLTANARRQRGLARGSENKLLFTLDKLVRLHAGDVAGTPIEQTEAFYGQCWALARMLNESPNYRPLLLKMLTDLRGDQSGPNGRAPTNTETYRPATVRPMLLRYFQSDWEKFERDYDRFVARQTQSENAPD